MTGGSVIDEARAQAFRVSAMPLPAAVHVEPDEETPANAMLAALWLLERYESVLTGLRIELAETRVERDVLRRLSEAQPEPAPAPTRAPRQYVDKVCLGCRQPFTPRSGSAQRCDPCRRERFAEQRMTARP